MTALDLHTEAHAVDPEQQQQQQSLRPEQPQQQQHAHDCARQQQELAKLRVIETHVQQIRDKLVTRLPLQRRLLAARVCGAIWIARVRLAKMPQSEMQANASQLAKKLRLELGAFDYQTKEQSELLTRELCALDDILSNGDAAIKSARKALVVAIQNDALPLADALRDQSARLKSFGDAMLVALPMKLSQSAVAAVSTAVSTTTSTAAQAQSMSTKVATTASSSSDSDDVEMALQNDLGSSATHDAGGDNNTDSGNEHNDEDEDKDEDEDDDSMDEDTDTADAMNSDADASDDDMDAEINDQSDGDDDETNSNIDAASESDSAGVCSTDTVDAHMLHQPLVSSHRTPAHSPRSTRQCSYHQQQRKRLHRMRQLSAAAIQSLPVWRPYYELQRRHDGLCVVANLRGVEPANVHVQWLERAGVLRIAGYKLPTQKDLAVTRFSGVSTFGRFEITERLPSDVFAMRDATQVLRADGTFEIRLPFDATSRWQRQCVQPTRRQFHSNPFDCSSLGGMNTARCMVW